MIKIYSSSTPATHNIVEGNQFNNNSNIVFSGEKYISVSELNSQFNKIPVDTNVILIDFVSDIIFGNVEKNGVVYTRNTWTNKFPQDAKIYSTPMSETSIKTIEADFNVFFNKATEQGMKVIINSFRYANSMTEDNLGSLTLDSSFPTKKFRETANVLLERLEKHLLNKFSDLQLISFHEGIAKNEKNHPVKRYSFYMNEDYYVDTFVQLEKILNAWYPGEVSTYSSGEIGEVNKLINNNTDVLLVTGPSELLRNAWYEKEINDALTSLEIHDYILDGKRGNEYRFIKRTNWSRHGLKQFITSTGNKIHYSDTRDALRLKSDKPTRMVILFMGMPGAKTFNSENAEYRLFPGLFNNFTRSLVKDTVVIRIADIDGIRGGFYVNSVNYPDYEFDISEFIEKIISEYQVKKSDVVLHGTSKGAAGALYYGAKLDINTVVIDPVLDGTHMINEERNNHFTKDFRLKNNLVPTINSNIESNETSTHYVFGNHYVNHTWQVLKQLNGAEIIDIADKTVTTHKGISPNSVPEWLTYINSLLLGNNFISNKADKKILKILKDNNRLLKNILENTQVNGNHKYIK